MTQPPHSYYLADSLPPSRVLARPLTAEAPGGGAVTEDWGSIDDAPGLQEDWGTLPTTPDAQEDWGPID